MPANIQGVTHRHRSNCDGNFRYQ